MSTHTTFPSERQLLSFEPAFHLVRAEVFERTHLQTIADRLGHEIFTLDASGVGSEEEFIAKMTVSLKFNESFGKNWNALLELIQDLSWVDASGYLLVIHHAGHLSGLSKHILSELFQALESAVRYWEFGREEVEACAVSKPFKIVFLGDPEVLRGLVGQQLRASVCIYEKDFRRVISAPGRLSTCEAFRSAKHLLARGDSVNTVLAALRKNGMDEIDSLYCIAGLFVTTLKEARRMMLESQVWSEIRERDEIFQQIAMEAREDFS